MWVYFTGKLGQYKSRLTPGESKPYLYVAFLVSINFLINMHSKWWCIIQNLSTHTLAMNVKEWDFYIVPVHFLQLSGTRWLVIKKGSFSLRVLACSCHIWSASGELIRLPLGWRRCVKGRWAHMKRARVRIETAGNSGGSEESCSVVTNSMQCKLILLIDTGSYLQKTKPDFWDRPIQWR